MAGKTSSWLLGCGIGCGLVLLAGSLVLGGGFLCVRGTVNRLQEVQQSQTELEDAYGGITDFVPQPDGAIPAPRLEKFLSVRESLVPLQRRIAETLAIIVKDESENGKQAIGHTLRTIKAATGILPLIGNYIKIRNRSLMEAGMGPGEYFYIHTIVYHSWLGYSPADGAEDMIVVVDGSSDTRIYGHDSAFGEEPSTHRYQTYMVALLKNQLEAISSEGVASSTAAQLHERLQSEINALEENPARAPWQGGLPTEIETSLAPYRRRLESMYCKTTNIFDLFSLKNDD